MTNGSAAMHITDGGFAFTADDVGQPIWIIGAAAPIGGATENGMLRTYILSVSDSTHAVAGNVALGTTDPLLVSNATLFRQRGKPYINSGNLQNSLNAHDVLSISFLDDLARPQVRQPVLFTVQGENLFGGTIDNVEGSNVPGTNLAEWKLDCVSWDKTCYKRTTGEPTETSGSPAVSNPSAGVFVNWTVGDIMRYLIVHALGSEGLDFYPLVYGPVIPTFTASYASCGDAFDQLVKAGSDGTTVLHWYVDAWKVIFLADQVTTAAPWDVSDSDPGSILASVSCTWDRSEYINRAIVRIGNEISDPIPFTFIGDGSTKTFQTTEPVAATPTITEDGVDVSVGVQGINTGSAWYWNQGSTAITQDPAGAPLAAGVVLVVNAPVFRNGVVAYLNSAAVDESTALESGTGYYESVMQQDGPATATDGITLAQSIATQYGVIPKRLQIRTFRPGLKIGQYMTVTLAKFDISAAHFVIDSVSLTTEENLLLWSVTMVGSPFINWDYRATLAMLRPGSGGGAIGGGSIGQSGPQLFWRTILVKDSTAGTNIADNLTVQATGQGARIAAVLRVPIASDLIVVVNKGGAAIGTITIPSSTPVRTEVETSIKNIKFVDGQILTFDITASDGQKNKNGVAAITVEWGATDTPVTVTGQWKGAWDNSATYAMGDSVSRDGSSWISLQDTNTGNDPSSSPSWWDVIAAEGSAGTPGAGVPTGGTAGQILTKVSSTDYDDTWADPSTFTVLTTKGDLMTYGPVGSPAVNQPVRLGVGADGQTLIADSSEVYGLKWGGAPTNAYISSLITGPDTSKTIAGGTHGYATAALLVMVYDNSSPRNAIESGWTVDGTTYDVVITFATAQSNYYVVINGAAGPAGATGATGPAGPVSSVGLSMPAEFSVASSPITTSGTIAVTKQTQSANTVYAGPTTGSAAAPTFRAVVAADLPLGSSSAFGAVKVDNVTITASAGVITAVGGSGTVTHTGSLTANLPVLGNGTADVKIGTAAQLVPTLPADATKYLDGTGAFTVPTGGTGTVTHTGSLTANKPVIGNGTADVTIGTSSGNTTEFATVTGSLTSGHIATWDASGNLQDGGAAPAAGAFVLLEQHTAANSSPNLDFTTFYSSSYDEYAIEFVNLVPATNNIIIQMRMSTDGGSTYDSGSNYSCVGSYLYSGGTGVGTAADSATLITLWDGVSNSSNYGFCGNARFFSPGSTSLYKVVTGQGFAFSGSASKIFGTNFWGVYRSATAVNAFRVFSSSGNLTSGIVRIYGIAK